jgi:D-lactate dehydrogenase (cytochrome)
MSDASSTETSKAIERLKEGFGARIQTGLSFRQQHGHTTSYIRNEPPDAVFAPNSAAEVQQVVKLCSDMGFPIIPFGAGSSLEGQLNAPRGGLSLDMSKMNAILAINTEDLDCVVEPGVTRHQLNNHIKSEGLFFPIDPGADASLGGMASTRASGTNAVRYGTMKQNVLSAKVVLPNGELITTGSRARKSSAGYDLTSLFVGAEGTLGVFTELSLRLYGLPQKIVSGTCTFPTIHDATRAVIETIQSGLPVARIELIDSLCIRAINAYNKMTLEEAPGLFFEFHGIDSASREDISNFEEICVANRGLRFESASAMEDRNRLWKARHDLYFAFAELRRNAKGIPTDICVPISRLAACIDETERDLHESALLAPIVGHVGDGNFHLMILVDTSDGDEMGRAFAAIERLNARAIAYGGTCTGEHGIGQGKRRFMPQEFGAAVDVMRAVKSAIDPLGIMNPDKIF